MNSEKNHENEISTHNEKTSDFSAFFHIVCAIAGPSILGLPISMQQGGWASILILTIAGLMSWYGGVLIIECLYFKTKNFGKRIDTYPELGYQSFGTLGMILVQIGHYSIILGTVCLFIIFISTNLQDMIHRYGLVNLEFYQWVLISSLIIGLPYSILKSIKEIVIMSLFGVLTTVIAILFVVIYSFILYPDLEPVTRTIFNGKGLPLALSTISFAFGGSVVFPHVEHSMKNPKKWNFISFIAFLSVYIGGSLVCITGYVVFGDNVTSPIFNNLPFTIYTDIAIILIILHVTSAAPVYLCTFGLEIEARLNITKEKLGNKEFLTRFLIRLLTVSLLGLIAFVIPYFDAVIPLIGSISDGFIMFIVPVVCHLKLFGFFGRPWHQYIAFFLIFLLGVVGCIFGTYDAVENLINKINSSK